MKALKRGANNQCAYGAGAMPTGLRMNCWLLRPTLKRGANNRCAYGAGFRRV